MLGWMPVKRKIDGVNFPKVKDRILSIGYNEFDVQAGYTVFKKSGTSMSTDIQKIPLKLKLMQVDASIGIELRYDCFCLFDTGDLKGEADKIVEFICNEKISAQEFGIASSPETVPQQEEINMDIDAINIEEPEVSISIVGLFNTLFTNYKEFLNKYLIRKKPPFLFIVIWLFGMSSIIDNLAVQEYQIQNWSIVWGIILILGILAGYIGSRIGGRIYHFFVKICGGQGEYHISRNLFIYTGLSVYLVTVASQIYDTFVYGNKYFIEPTNATVDLTWFGLIVIGIIYSIFLSYNGVRLLHNTKKVRSIIFFVIIPIIFHSLVFGRIFLQSYQQYSNVLEYNDQAVEQMYLGNYDEAVKLFESALDNAAKEDKEEIKLVYSNLGLLYEYKGDPDKAAEYYQKVLSSSENNRPEYHSTLGKINILKNNIQEAVNNFEEALKIDTDDFDANNRLGLVYLGEINDEIWDYAKALKYNEKAYELSPDASTMQNLAINYFTLRKYTDAQPLFESIINFNPNNALAKYFMGLISYMQKDLEKAKKLLNEAVTIEPSLMNEDIKNILNE